MAASYCRSDRVPLPRAAAFRFADAARKALLLTVLAAAGAAPVLALPATARAAEEPKEADPRGDAVIRSGLPVPRFVTLRSDEVNVRTGPGVRYPVDWVFVRKGMPVEITAEFDTWRRIRDWEGTQGWVHQSMLSGRRSLLVTGKMRTLRREASENAEAIAQAEPGVIGRLRKCHGSWCQVELQGYRGWLRRDELWGVYPGEDVDD
jgi:SH3-like domain-containing protein